MLLMFDTFSQVFACIVKVYYLDHVEAYPLVINIKISGIKLKALRF